MNIDSLQVHMQLMDILRVHNHPDQHDMVGWWILQEVSGRSHASLLAHRALSEYEQHAAVEMVQRLVTQRIPLAYLIGWVSFGDLRIRVVPPVLIPRPETVEWVTDVIADYAAQHKKPRTVLDLCTGSGCIALCLAHAWPWATVCAVDIDPRACDLARINAKDARLEHVTVVRDDITVGDSDELRSVERYDVITANPPYVAPHEWDTLAAEITGWEAQHAHVADDRGYAIIEAILHGAVSWLTPEGMVYIEIGHEQGAETVQRARAYGYRDIQVRVDSAGRDRVLVARRPCEGSRSDI